MFTKLFIERLILTADMWSVGCCVIEMAAGQVSIILLS